MRDNPTNPPPADEPLTGDARAALLDHIRHALVFTQAAERDLRAALALLEKGAHGGEPHDHNA
jgi:hypothetical protein